MPLTSCMRENPSAALLSSRTMAVRQTATVKLATFCSVSGLVVMLFAIPAEAQTTTDFTETKRAFFDLVTGKWAQIADNANLSIANTQYTIAALQCHSAKDVDAGTATEVTRIPATVSQSLSKLIVYQKRGKGLNRIDFSIPQAQLFPKIKLGPMQGGRLSFILTSPTASIRIRFTRIRQGTASYPVMLEGDVLFLKCPFS